MGVEKNWRWPGRGAGGRLWGFSRNLDSRLLVATQGEGKQRQNHWLWWVIRESVPGGEKMVSSLGDRKVEIT